MRKDLFEEHRDVGSNSEPMESGEDGGSIAAGKDEGEDSELDNKHRDGTYEPGSESSSETEEDLSGRVSEERDEGEQDVKPSTVHQKYPKESQNRGSEGEDVDLGGVFEKRRRIKDKRYNTGRETARKGRIDREGNFVWIPRRGPNNNNLQTPGDRKPCPRCGHPQPANKSMKKHMTMCERKKCGICGVIVNHSSLPRHIKGVHAGTEEAEELVRNALRYKEVGSPGRPRKNGKKRKNEETCDRCGKRVLAKHMERHMRNIHENRPKARKNGVKEKTPNGVSEQGDAQDADEEMTTADEIPAFTKGESASGSARDADEVMTTADENPAVTQGESASGGAVDADEVMTTADGTPAATEGESASGSAGGADEVMTTAEEIPAATEEESASGSASSEAQQVAELWRLYRESPEKCRLCNYKGNEAEMTSHLMNTHVTPIKETTSNKT